MYCWPESLPFDVDSATHRYAQWSESHISPTIALCCFFSPPMYTETSSQGRGKRHVLELQFAPVVLLLFLCGLGNAKVERLSFKIRLGEEQPRKKVSPVCGRTTFVAAAVAIVSVRAAVCCNSIWPRSCVWRPQKNSSRVRRELSGKTGAAGFLRGLGRG